MNPNYQIDKVNAVIRGVSVITLGEARGHGLTVDRTTLKQMFACAEKKGQLTVKIDHGSGAAAVCGFLRNFRISGRQLLADFFLLKSHPQCEQILEIAERMPGGAGLSAAFFAPENAEKGRARCSEILSVDFVSSPASNAGLFSARINGTLHQFSSSPQRAQERAPIHRIIKAVRDNVSAPVPAIPYGSQVDWVHQKLRENPRFTKRTTHAIARAIVGGAGAGLLAKKFTKSGHVRAGAVAAGAALGVYLSTDDKTDFMETSINDAVSRHAPDTRAGQREAHDLHSLSRRVALAPHVLLSLIEKGLLRPVHELSRNDPDGPQIWESDELNNLRGIAFEEVAKDAVDEIIELGRDPRSSIGNSFVMAAMREHSILFGGYREDEDQSIGEKVAKGAAVVGGAAGLTAGALYLRGRAALKKTGAPGVAGFLPAAKAGVGAFKNDAAGLLEKIRRATAK